MRLVDRGRPRRLSGAEIKAMTADTVAKYLAAREDWTLLASCGQGHSKREGREAPSVQVEAQARTHGVARAEMKPNPQLAGSVEPFPVVPIVLALGLFLCSAAAAFYTAAERSNPAELFIACGILMALSGTVAVVLALRGMDAEPSGAVTDRWGR